MEPINQTPLQSYQPPVTPATPQMPTPASKTPLVLAFVIGAVVVALGVWAWAHFSGQPAASPSPTPSVTVSMSTSPTPSLSATPITTASLNEIFGLAQKIAGTKLFYSDKLGVGFTYSTQKPYQGIKAVETGNKIDISGQSVEVFSKDPGVTLAQAIQSQFLVGYSPNDCFVVSYSNPQNKQGLMQYVAAQISFPAPTDSSGNSPWFENAAKCPNGYSQTNAAGYYFLMNKDVPGKFVFVKLGQDVAAFDGTLVNGNLSYSWDYSLRILK